MINKLVSHLSELYPYQTCSRCMGLLCTSFPPDKEKADLDLSDARRFFRIPATHAMLPLLRFYLPSTLVFSRG